jgi:hypothetical protein
MDEDQRPTETHSAETETHGFHLPPPSILPAALALGITCLLTGLVLSPILLLLGVVITIVSFVLWVRDARREYRGLPGH